METSALPPEPSIFTESSGPLTSSSDPTRHFKLRGKKKYTKSLGNEMKPVTLKRSRHVLLLFFVFTLRKSGV